MSSFDAVLNTAAEGGDPFTFIPDQRDRLSKKVRLSCRYINQGLAAGMELALYERGHHLLTQGPP
jgi:hypothetical protein